MDSSSPSTRRYAAPTCGWVRTYPRSTARMRGSYRWLGPFWSTSREPCAWPLSTLTSHAALTHPSSSRGSRNSRAKRLSYSTIGKRITHERLSSESTSQHPILYSLRRDLKHRAENKEREGALCMELRGERLVLTSVTIEEAPVLLPAFNGDEQFNQWSGHASGLTQEQVQADMLGTLNQPSGAVWRLADQNGALVGVAKTALLPSPDTGWIDLLVIRRAFQGRGYGAEAATLLETHLFSSPGIRQIALAVLVENTPAMAFWEKRGYVRRGRYLDNEGDDVYAYVLPRPPSTA